MESVDHLKTDRTEADILYELLLKLGLDLCVPIEKKRISGKDVHSIGGGVLLACLADKITREQVGYHRSRRGSGEDRQSCRRSAAAGSRLLAARLLLRCLYA